MVIYSHKENVQLQDIVTFMRQSKYCDIVVLIKPALLLLF